MKENVIKYKDKEYALVFNFNVMEAIQEEYGTFDKWATLADGAGDGQNGEPSAKAVKFGFMAAINEGIDIENEENGTDDKPLTLKQIGRMITEIGMTEAAKKLSDTVNESTQSAEKNV